MFYSCLYSKSFDFIIFTLKYTECQENIEARNKIYIIDDCIKLAIEIIFDF